MSDIHLQFKAEVTIHTSIVRLYTSTYREAKEVINMAHRCYSDAKVVIYEMDNGVWRAV